MFWIPNGLLSRLTLMNISGVLVCESRPAAAAEYEEMKGWDGRGGVVLPNGRG